MATYQAGVTDYISQIQPTEPNLAFDAQILQTKQTKFDANHQKISELYGSILNSAMSRNENIAARDQFVKTINSDIVKMAGMDFSLDENVDAAANVFQSIYNNNHIVKDMVWTKNFQSEKSKGESLKNCIDPEKCGGQWWEQGDQYMDYKLKEFKNASNDESLGFENVEYIPYTNMMEKAMKYAKDNKLEISSDQLVGNYMVTTKNGPQAYGPLAELFTNLYSSDPKLLKQYEAQAYVNRKNNVSSIMSETGLEENEATAEYIRRQGTTQQDKINKILDQANADEDYITGRITVLEEQLNTGKFGKESGVAKEYMALKQLLPGAQQASQYIKLAKMTGENSNDNTYVRNMASRLDTRDAALFMHEDINGAAKTIADNTMTEKKEVDAIAKLGVEHQYAVMLEGVKQSNRVALESHKASLKNDPANPFAGGGKEAKALSEKTVSGYIDDTYKAKYGDAKITGIYDTKIAEAKKVMETEAENKSSDAYKKAAADLARLKPFNDENIMRQKVQKLDGSGFKPATGGNFSNLFNEDKKASGRTKADFDANNKSSRAGVSQSMGTIHGRLNGTNQEVHDEQSVEAKLNKNSNKESFEQSDVTPDSIPKFKQFALDNKSQLTADQQKFYENLKPDSVLSPALKKKMAETSNKIKESNGAKLTPKDPNKITGKNITADVIQEVIDTHPDPKVVEKYKYLKKQGLSNLSEDVKNNIAVRYNALKSTSFTVRGENTQSNITTGEAYSEVYHQLDNDMHKNTSVVNKAYINALEKNSPEYKVLKEQALEYLRKHAERRVDKVEAANWLGSNDPKTGVYFMVGGQSVRSSGITDWQLQHIIDKDSNFSNAIYRNVKNKIVKGTDKIKAISKDGKVNNAIHNIDNIEEDLQNHIKLKKDNHNTIVDKMSRNDKFDHPFNPDYVKNGFLVGFNEFYETMKYRTDYDREDAYDEYKVYSDAYEDGLHAALIQKATKDKKYLSKGVGPQVYPVYGADNVNLQAIDANATKDVRGFLDNFNAINPENKVLYIGGSPITDPKEVQKYIAEIKRSKEYFNTSYKVQGVDGPTESGKNNWEGMSITDTKSGWEYSFRSDPAVRPSKMYLDKVQSSKDRSLQQTGRTQLSSGNEYTNNKKVYVVQKTDGSLRFEGNVHVDGKDVDLNSFLYNTKNDYDHTITSFEDAAAVFQDIMDDLESK
jgi:hypothetical protein